MGRRWYRLTAVGRRQRYACRDLIWRARPSDISAHTQAFWPNLCGIVGLPELATDPRCDNIRKRSIHADELLPKLHAALQSKSAQEWEALMTGQVPCSAAHSIEHSFDHAQVLAKGLVAHFPDPTLGGYRSLARPIQFSANGAPPNLAAPTLGQHTDETLAKYGRSTDDIGRLRASGAVG